MKDVPRNLKSYYLCLLRKGPQWNETSDSPALMLEHLAFLRAQLEARKFLIAGPILGTSEDDASDDIVGISILEAPSAEEALVLANQDPGAKAGRLRMEIRHVLLPALDAVQVEY
jgi:uncharacterized protein YciI